MHVSVVEPGLMLVGVDDDERDVATVALPYVEHAGFLLLMVLRDRGGCRFRRLRGLFGLGIRVLGSVGVRRFLRVGHTDAELRKWQLRTAEEHNGTGEHQQKCRQQSLRLLDPWLVVVVHLQKSEVSSIALGAHIYKVTH